jgi:thiol-disulfide isomerase/thioredoxin
MLLGSLWLSAAVAGETSGQQLAESVGKGLVGSAAPKLVLKTIDGETIDLGSLYGKKAVYLKFWATWCVPCRQQMPHFEHAYEQAGTDLAVIAIDVGLGDSLQAIRTFRGKAGISMPIVFDEDGHVGAAFKLRVTPQHVIIGRDGRIQYIGHLADAPLDAALLAARSPGAQTQQVRVAGAHASIEPPAIAVGDPLPTQSAHLLDGTSFHFQESRAHRQTVSVFLSPWCESYLATTRPEVSASCRRVREQVSAHAGDPRVRVLGIASGLWAKDQDLRQYRQDYKVPIPLTLDASGTLFREFRVNDVPTVIVADDQGKVVQRIEPKDAQGLQKTLEAL